MPSSQPGALPAWPEAAQREDWEAEPERRVAYMAGRGESIGFLEAYSIGVGGMIGGGIFAVLGLSLELAGYAAPIAFLISGLVALLTAYSYAKLSVRFPSEGGTVEFLVRGFGDGLLAGGLNVLLLVSYTVMIALYSYAFGSYAAAALGEPWLRGLFSALVIAAFVVINALGAVVSGRVEDALVLFKVAVLVIVAGAGASLVDWSRFSPSNWPPFTSIVAGGMIIFLAYEGFELIANASADVEDPSILPKAFYASVLTVIAVYVGVALVSAGVLPLDKIQIYRDYALAEAAKPSLGEAGFILVTLAALASTSSAINATLYGTAGISYVVAKYGQLPPRVGRSIWGRATEGLVLIAAISLLLVETVRLEAISTAGSGGFLIVFTAVNLAAYRLRRAAKVNPLLALAGAAATSFSLLILSFRMLEKSPGSLELLALLVAGSFAAEALYRRLKRRRLAEYIDEKLRLREENIRRWEEWLPRLAAEARRVLRDAEVYLVGGVARGELESSHDVDVLIVTRSKPRTRREERELKRELKRRAGLTKLHPVDIHFAAPEEKEKWLRHSRASKKIEPKAATGDTAQPRS